jgi:subtilisin family serine protease
LKDLSREQNVLEVEANSTIESSESERGSKAAAKLETLGNLFATRKGVDYYGNHVLATYVSQPGTQIIELGQALTSFGSGGGIVAVIDTGVDPNHPALRGALVPGYDFTRDRPDTYSELNDLDPSVAAVLSQSTVEILDSKKFVVALTQSTVEILDQSTVEILDGKGLPSAFGHGTMVSGLIHLVAPTARIMPLKAFHADGSASLFDIDRAIRYAADHGASVISMSFSYSISSDILQAAVSYAQSRGVMMIAAAGNDGKSMAAYPASYHGVVGVGSTNFSDRRSVFSNFGKSARTSAPGEALVTLYPGGNYAAVWGTSFSTALVSGAVTLMRSIAPRLRSGSLGDILEHGVHIDQGMGEARLDLVDVLTFCLLTGGYH